MAYFGEDDPSGEEECDAGSYDEREEDLYILVHVDLTRYE